VQFPPHGPANAGGERPCRHAANAAAYRRVSPDFTSGERHRADRAALRRFLEKYSKKHVKSLIYMLINRATPTAKTVTWRRPPRRTRDSGQHRRNWPWFFRNLSYY
jgi:hypothetical protein